MVQIVASSRIILYRCVGREIAVNLCKIVYTVFDSLETYLLGLRVVLYILPIMLFLVFVDIGSH